MLSLSFPITVCLSICYSFICLTLSFCIKVFPFVFVSVLVWVLIEQNHRWHTTHTHSHSSQGQFRSYYLFRCIQSFGVWRDRFFFNSCCCACIWYKILVLMQNIFCVFICLFVCCFIVAFVVARRRRRVLSSKSSETII